MDKRLKTLHLKRCPNACKHLRDSHRHWSLRCSWVDPSHPGLRFQDKVIIGLAFDCVDKMVYWTDISEPSIGRASLHGGEPATIIRQGGRGNAFLSFWFRF